MTEPQPSALADGGHVPSKIRDSSPPHSATVGLNEAALDSPTFRSTVIHFSDQVESVERWLSNYATATSKLTHDVQALEETINTYLSKTMPSAADGIIENDYTFLALKHVGDGSREYWQQMLSSTKRTDQSVIEPIRSFLANDIKNFKESRRSLETTQRAFDTALARYAGQSKTKEPSSLREDAFSLYESRKAYVLASMDFCQLAPQLLFAVDKLLVRVSGEVWKELRRSRDALAGATRWGSEMDHIRGWAKEMEGSEGILTRELHSMRKELLAPTLEAYKPSRELEDYSRSTVPFLGSRGPVNIGANSDEKAMQQKQGWLFLRMATAKPVRHTWVRRWYYCRDGVFGWLTAAPHGVLQGDEIGVLLCNAKPAVGEDRRFCFEIKTKSLNLMLQADTQKELLEWLETFEATKKKAFEESMNRDTSPLSSSVDPAFSITPTHIPEFSAKQLDGLGVDDAGPPVDRTSTLPAPPSETHLAPRQSFDPASTAGRRSITALGRDLSREEGESGREHAARLIQRLDAHRKAAFGSGSEAGLAPSNSASGGIASLISASHNLLPVYSGAVMGSSTMQKPATAPLPAIDTHASTLAPLTLAKPPAMTHLSRIAVLNSADRKANATLPASIMANYWGSHIWTSVQIPEEVTPSTHDDDDPIGVVMSDNAKMPMSVNNGQGKVEESFPPNYPPELKAQHQQFRLLFPNVSCEEKLVLVVRAVWQGSNEAESSKQRLLGDGRIFITPENMYFYGSQLGMVTTLSIALEAISEVTATAGKDLNQIVLHLAQSTAGVDYTRIVIKVFLDDLHVILTRLNLLVDNLQAEEPMDTMDLIRALITIESDINDHVSPSVDTWENTTTRLPAGSGKPMTEESRQQRSDPATSSQAQAGANSKIHLPAYPVVYEPDDMKELAAERHFDISAKACFHVLFGDKSFVFPKLYFERRAQQIAQGPWTLIDHGQMRREFQFNVDYSDILGRAKTANVLDTQTIEMYSDHITYVVTDAKTAWHLPHSRNFKTVTKIVITHVAKSKCRLAIYVRIDWSRAPALSKNLVERQALRDAQSNADELAEVATDQIRKLGTRRRTNRAIQVYGHVGQQTQVVVFSPASKDSSKGQAIKPRTLTAMAFETVRSIAESAVTSLIMWAFAGLRQLFKIVSAQRLLIIALGLSALLNLFLSSCETATLWKERRAATFMQQVGVGPNMHMSKAVYISDLAEAAGDSASHLVTFPQNSTCYTAFSDLVDTVDMNSPWQEAGSSLTTASSQAAARRLRRSRQRLGSYRHDLLVAMRVVNSVERETLHQEWKNWLVHEKTLCDDLASLLGPGSKGSKKVGSDGASQEAQSVLRSMSKEEKRKLQKWKDEHCGSCQSDLEALRREEERASWL